MILDFTFVQTVQVETYSTGGSFGPSLATAVPKACRVQDESQLVVDAQGRELTSNTTLFGPLSDADAYTPNSRVTLPTGQVAQVISVTRFDSGSMGLGLDHIEVHLS